MADKPTHKINNLSTTDQPIPLDQVLDNLIDVLKQPHSEGAQNSH